jgi:hypothetical protein
MKITRFVLRRVHFMPKVIESGVLYVSEEFGAVAHLCACGCGEKVRTPLGPTEWKFDESREGPTLYPSIGNWQKPCKSHYWIKGGKVIWASAWTSGQVIAGRKSEEERAQTYYSTKDHEMNIFQKWWRSVCAFFFGE